MMRKRGSYVILILGVVVIGLLSRAVSGVPKWFGDVFWGLMVFFIMCFFFRNRSSLKNTLLSVAFSIGIEVAKLYHTPWLDDFRCTTLGGLLLGHAFSWENIFCYLAGIAVGSLGEYLWLNNVNKTYQS